MSISFDHATSGSFSGSSSLNFSQTVSAVGGLLIVDVLTNGSPVNVDFVGVFFTLLAQFGSMYTFGLYNPVVQTANITVNATGGTYTEAGSCLYYGARHVAPDNSSTNNVLANTQIDTALTPVSVRCWAHLFCAPSAPGGITPTGCVSRVAPNASEIFDSNDLIAGLTTLTLTGSSRDWSTLMVSLAPSTTTALPAVDYFNRANAASLGANWTNHESAPTSPRVSSNQAIASADAGDVSAYWSADAFTNNHYSEAVAPTVGAYMGLVVRGSGTAAGANCQGYVWFVNLGFIYYIPPGGSFSQIAGPVWTIPADGSTCRLTIIGTVMTGYINGVVAGTFDWFTQAASLQYTGGAPGLAWSGAGGVAWDNWTGDNLAAALATDDFNRSDAGSLGTNWTTQQVAPHSPRIVSNRAVASADGVSASAFYNIGFDATHYSQVTVPSAAAADYGVGVRMTGTAIAASAQGYLWTGNSGQLYKIQSDGTFSLLDSGWPVPSNGDTIALAAIGSTLQGYINGVPISSKRDTSSYSGGRPGIGFSSANAAAVDNWIGSDGSPATTFTDNFVRANSATLGDRWTDLLAGMSIVSNAAVPDAAAIAVYSYASWPANQASELIANVNARYYLLAVRAVSDGAGSWNGYGALIDTISGVIFLQSVTGGVGSTLQTISGLTTNLFDGYRLTVSGSTLRVFWNDVNGGYVQVGTDSTDATYATGSAGVGGFLDTNTPAVGSWTGTCGIGDRTVYNIAKKELLKLVSSESSVVSGKAIKAMLILSTYTFNPDDQSVLAALAGKEATGATRQTVSSLSSNEDDTNDFGYILDGSPVFPSVTTGQTLGGMATYWDVDGTDANAVPLAFYAFTLVTSGSNVNITFAGAGSGGALKAA